MTAPYRIKFSVDRVYDKQTKIKDFKRKKFKFLDCKHLLSSLLVPDFNSQFNPQ